MAEKKPRRAHTRSRTGCLACRRRHVRCDQGKPICNNCLYRNRECEFPTPTIEPRTQRDAAGGALPGVLPPWVVTGPASDRGLMDPFGTWPIGMSPEAQELLMYFIRGREKRGLASPLNDPVAAGLKDAASLRCVVLIAGLYFRASAKGFYRFEGPFLQNKIRCIQSVNEMLSEKPDHCQDASMIILIATLCMTECSIKASTGPEDAEVCIKADRSSVLPNAQLSLGNIIDAEAHLDGLMALLQARCKTDKWLSLLDARTTTATLLQRYVLICIRELWTARSAKGHPGNTRRATTATAAVLPWTPGIEGLCVLPSCLVMTDAAQYVSAKGKDGSGSTMSEIDARDAIRGLRFVTAGCSAMRGTPSADRRRPASVVLNKLWAISGGEQQPFLATPLEIRDDLVGDDPSFRTPWVGLAICTNFYMHAVLGLWRSSHIEEVPASLWVVRVVQADLERTWPGVSRGARSRELWFWRLYVVLMCVEQVLLRAQGNRALPHPMSSPANPTSSSYQRVKLWCQAQVRRWSVVAGVTEWAGAKIALRAITWPDGDKSPLDRAAESLWIDALAQKD